jgi:archaellum component FlaG (FlaF/FlaG flagellin family)
MGVSLFFTAILAGAATILASHLDKADTNKNGRVDSTEIEEVYRIVGKPFYNGLTDSDLELYLKRTDPNQQ